jgi:predicted ATPase
LATALNIPPGAGDEPLRPLIAALKPLQMLLVLDNAEHLSDVVARLAQAVLCGTDGVRVLVTSQASLRLPHGHVYRLGPLQTPPSTPPADQALAYGAIALFAERARCLDRSFAVTDANVATIADICRSLDGVALAIELATARLPLLGLQGLQQRLGDRFRLLTGGAAHAPSRQQTLRAALDWSHALLASKEQAVFRALGVFVGGFTLELASAVASHDGIDEWAVIDILDVLVDHSLVAVDTGVEPRYRLLESAREYALLCLDTAGEREQAQRRHSQAMLQLAERADQTLWTMPEVQWLARHAPDIDNIRAALEWSSAHALPLAVGLAGSSSPLFFAMSLLHESRRRCDPLHERLQSAEVPQRAQARFFRARSEQLRDASIVLQHEFAVKAVQLYRQLGDDRGLYLALYEVTAGFQVYDRAAAEAAEEMARLERPDWPAALRALRWIGESKARYAQGQLPQNRAALEAALPLVQAAGTDRLTSVVLCNLADHALYVGAVDEAVQRGRQLSELLRRGKRNFHLAFSLANLAAALLQQGQVADARERLAEALHLMRTLEWSGLGAFGEVYALLAAREGRIEAAARLIGWADKTSSARGERQPNEARCRALAEAEVLQWLGASQAALLMAEGAGLDEEAVAELTLAMPQVRSEA